MVDEAPGPSDRRPEEGAPSTSPDGPGIIDFLTMGLASALCLAIGGGVGYALDAAVHTGPVLTFVGLAFGVVSAVLVTVAQVRRHL